MNNSIRNQLRGLGSELSPPMIQATQRLFAGPSPVWTRRPPSVVTIVRNR